MRQSNEFVIDGAPDNAITDTQGDRSRANQNVAYIPTVDTTQEFKVVTNFYDAQYGSTGGGVISVSTKSGTNDYHGTVYDFLRRYQWDANNTVANAAGRPIYAVDPVTEENLGGHKLDQYGGLRRRPGQHSEALQRKGQDILFVRVGELPRVHAQPRAFVRSTAGVRGRAISPGSGVTIFDPLTTSLNPSFDPTQTESVTNPQYIRTPVPGQQDPAGPLEPGWSGAAERVSGTEQRYWAVQQLPVEPEPQPGQVPQLARARGSQLRREGTHLRPVRVQQARNSTTRAR